MVTLISLFRTSDDVRSEFQRQGGSHRLRGSFRMMDSSDSPLSATPADMLDMVCTVHCISHIFHIMDEPSQLKKGFYFCSF